jgi:hypothetical protein
MCLDVFVWQFYSCFSFSRYESHYAIPLGRKKGAKLVGFLCCRCDYRINVFGGKSALGEFFPFFLRPKPKKVNWIRRGRNIRRKKWKHERLLLKWHLASMNSLWLGGSMVHKSTKFYPPLNVAQPIWTNILWFFAACISSRPGQSGRCDGYILEGKELEFYIKKIRAKKSK